MEIKFVANSIKVSSELYVFIRKFCLFCWGLSSRQRRETYHHQLCFFWKMAKDAIFQRKQVGSCFAGRLFSYGEKTTPLFCNVERSSQSITSSSPLLCVAGRKEAQGKRSSSRQAKQLQASEAAILSDLLCF